MACCEDSVVPSFPEKVAAACSLGFTFGEAVRKVLDRTNGQIGESLYDRLAIEVSMCFSGERPYPDIRKGIAESLGATPEWVAEMIEQYGTSEKRFRSEKS